MTGEPALSRNWRWWVFAAWALTCVWFLRDRWFMIQWFVLPDTDDNMRMMQVRALMHGQGWYDLRQHRLNPPTGFNIHWSRLVDLPIAALIWTARLFVNGAAAERFAAAVAPMLPLAVAMSAMALVVRRLIDTRAFFVAIALMLCCQAALLMFMPMRIDHHGWQLALLVLAVAGLADGDPRRGGIMMGLASAASLAIGLELMPFLAIVGAAVALRWVWQPQDRDRLAAYGVSLAVGCALGYLVFTSYDSAVPRCDALSPVWLGLMVAAGWLAFALAQVRTPDWRVRLGAAAVGGAVVVGGFAWVAPQCLQRPEQVSPELMRLWLSNIREAKPLYVQPWTVAVSVAALPVIGVVGAVVASVRAWRTDRFAVWAPVALVSFTSLALLMWQTRMGPAAQLMAVPGATALAWAVVPRLAASGSVLVRTLGVVAAFLIVSGLAVQLALGWLPPDKPNPRMQTISRANARCPSIPAMRPIARIPRTTIFTFVDLGPRLIVLTHHDAIAGPYHRNGDAILDTHHAFGGTPQVAHAIMLRHGATLLMTCPNMNESTVYRARNPNGFYAQLAAGRKFDWLEPVPLPGESPLLLWRIRP